MEAVHCEALEEDHAQVLPMGTFYWSEGPCMPSTPDKEPCKYQRLLFG